MNNYAKFALLLFITGAICVGVWKLLKPGYEERAKTAEILRTSDSQKLSPIRVGGDGYIDYWYLTSPEMRKQAARNGLSVLFTDDKGDYASRMQKFANKEYDAIVLPVNSYLQHGAKYSCPGSIVCVIGPSNGQDGILGRAERFPKGSVEELNDPNLRIVYTPNSPSSFLLDLTIADFDLFTLKGSNAWRVEVDGSTAVYERLRKNDGDVFILWEPELSKALAEDKSLKYLWGSDKFSGYIVDVIVFTRSFIDLREADIVKFLDAYFMTQRIYAADRPRMLSDIRNSTGLSQEAAEVQLKKARICNLQDNCRLWFGIQFSPDVLATEGVVNTILACTDVLRRTGQLPEDPLKGDFSQVVYSKVLQTLLERTPKALGSLAALAIDFPPLDDEGWKKLKEVALLRIEPISFKSGSADLDDVGKTTVDKIAELVRNNYPDYRLAVRGHTGRGDEEENLKLSRERAEVVSQRLIAVHGIDADRVHAEGYGSSQPPKRRAGENERAFGYRLPRVEFVLLEGN